MLLFSILSRQGIHLLLVLSVVTEIIFVVTEIMFPLVVNSDCYVTTLFPLLQQQFFLELARCWKFCRNIKTLVLADLCYLLDILCHDRIVSSHDRVHSLVFCFYVVTYKIMLRHNSLTIYLKYVATDFRVVTTAFFKIFFKFCHDRKLYGRDLEISFQP